MYREKSAAPAHRRSGRVANPPQAASLPHKAMLADLVVEEVKCIENI
jgi:hypothetical protein